MAGGKLTPRQKMINMMYLVLTALLALNVTKEVLNSFQLIAQSLRSSTEKFTDKNVKLGDDLKVSVQKEVAQGNHKNENLIPMIEELNKKSTEMKKILDDHIEAMRSQAIGKFDPAKRQYEKPDELEKNYFYWMKKNGSDDANAGRGSGEAMKLRDELNGYVDWANNYYAKLFPFNKSAKSTFNKLAVDDTTGTADAGGNEHVWEYHTFHNVPVVANVAMLEKYKNDVEVIRTELLNGVASRLNQIEFKVDSLIAMDAPNSQVVAAGLPFETQLFVTAASKQMHPRFIGAGITVDPSGATAKLRVTASAATIPAGRSEGTQAYSATIEVPKADGSGNLTLRLNKTFKVVKPVVKIEGVAVNQLYSQCSNDVTIDVPALGEYYNPVISALPAGRIQVNVSPQNRRLVSIIPGVPAGSKVNLQVATNTNGQVISLDNSIIYTVVDPPKPNFELFVGNNRWDGTSPIARTTPVTLRVASEPNFARALAKDARYFMTGVKMLAAAGIATPQPVGRSNPSTSGPGPVSQLQLRFPFELEPGTKVYIQADDVIRVNFQNKNVPVPFSKQDLTMAVTVK